MLITKKVGRAEKLKNSTKNYKIGFILSFVVVMEKVKNSVLLKSVLTSIFNTASRRTSTRSANEVMGSSIKTLERKFDFLKYVYLNLGESSGDFSVSISPLIDSVPPEEIGRAIEAIIRIIYNDLSAEAGLYFVTELKELAGEDVSRAISECDADIDQVQLEQHYAYRRRERKKAIREAAKGGVSTLSTKQNLIGYGWGEVAHWKHEPGSKYCTLYDKRGNVLDKLNLDNIIKNYVERLSGYIDVDPREIEKEASIFEKEYKLLKMMLERDMDAEVAMVQLRINRDELNNMIKKLSQMEMIHYIDFNTLELTDVGIGYISKKEKKE